MTADEARTVAHHARGAHEVSPDADVASVTRCYIELPNGEPDVPSAVRDVRVWLVRFQRGIRWTELAVEERTGQIVRVRRSR